MAYTSIQALLVNKPQPVCVFKSQPLKDALAIMSINGFSQLPVVDEARKPIGILTEATIITALTQFGSKVEFLLVSHAMSNKVEKFEVDEDVTYVASKIVDSNVAFIVQDAKLIGILTTHDMAQYFLQRALIFMRVEQIETSIRDHVRAAYSEDVLAISLGANKAKNRADQINPDRLFGAINKYLESTGNAKVVKQDDALLQAFKVMGIDAPSNVEFEDLTLNEYITMLFDASKWQSYAHRFDPMRKEDLRSLLDRVRNIRNVLAHFRRELDAEEQTTLRFCADFFARHEPINSVKIEAATIPAQSDAQIDDMTAANTESNSVLTLPPEEMEVQSNGFTPEANKYAPFIFYLRNQSPDQENLRLSFEQIEEIIKAPLPNSARALRAWWANDNVGHSQSKDWLEAGWRVNKLNLSEQIVTFQRMNERTRAYVNFFSRLRKKLSEEGLVKLTDIQNRGTNWHTLIAQTPVKSLGYSVAIFAASFGYRSTFRIEMYLDTRDAEINKRIFDALIAQRHEIEEIVEMPLSWERRDHGKGCRIAAYLEGSILDDEEQHEKLIAQCARILPKLYEALNERTLQAAEAVKHVD